MCGIAGEAGSTKYIPFNTYNIEAMTRSLTHRGPDDSGYYCKILSDAQNEVAVHLGSRRLAIIDKEHGKQPFVTKNLALVFNGEIYNHEKIRTEIIKQVPFLTNCDTEAILRLYQVMGDKFIDRLEGMFAIAIWDGKQNALKLYRDRIGKKPLYYYYDEGRNVFLFASEIKAILANPLYTKKVNYGGLCHYICLQYVPEPETAYEGIKALMPGHKLEYKPLENKVEIEQYWQLKPDIYQFAGTDEIRYSVFKSVAEAVEKRLESEVPVGVYLSGGIDSAIVTAIAALSGQIKELHTFTMGFFEDAYNEIPQARYIAERYNTIHHTAKVTDINLREMAERIVDQYDQPFGDCSTIPTLKLAELSKQYITVALTGDGADEAFGGYPRYWYSKSMQMFLRMMTIWQQEGRELICKKEFTKDYFRDTYSWLMNPFEKGLKYGTRDEMMFVDALTYLPNDIIVKMERATMAYSIEARCPFLDEEVIQTAFSIPSSLKIVDNVGKFLLKETFRKYLPAEILSLPKRGFAVPMDEWLREGEGQRLVIDTLLNAPESHPIFNKATLNEAVSAHMSGKAQLGHGLWILIILELWLRKNIL